MLSQFQSSFLFPAGVVHSVAMPSQAQPLRITAADGASTLHGLHFAPEAGKASNTLILGFGGNGWNAIDTATTLRDLFPDDHVVVFFYRGYSPSGGAPSAEALISDAPLVQDAAVMATGAKTVIAVGFSIGSGVAATLATKRKVSAMILVTPFDSLERVASDHFPWAPVGRLFCHEIDAAAALRSLDVPTAIIAAERDELIGAARTEGLRKAARTLMFDRTIIGAGHNDIYQRSEFRDAIMEVRGKLPVSV